MIKLLMEYKELKKRLTPNLGFEDSIDEVIWNEGIMIAIENLFENVNEDVKKLIILNLL